MIQIIIFSKNRAAQLDLLLRSLKRLGTVAGQTSVLYAATTLNYAVGYELCRSQHPTVNFFPETDFREQITQMVRNGPGEHLMFLCDDDLVVRAFFSPHPGWVLRTNPDAICVSFRLGSNTTYCYSLRKQQETPDWTREEDGMKHWLWAGAEGDFGYPGALDGHVFSRNLLRALLANAEYTGPNELEDKLSQACSRLWEEFPTMICYQKSIITGVPVNIVNRTHQDNRNGEINPKGVEELNSVYLKGKRLNLGTIRAKDIIAAHNELKLVFS